MIQFDVIRFRIETHSVRAWHRANTCRRYVQHFGFDFTFWSRCEYRFLSIDSVDQKTRQRQSCSAWAVDLLSMMDLMNVWIVVRRVIHQFGSPFDDPEKVIHTERKIRGIQQARFFHRPAELGQMRLPARCADDDIASRLDRGANIFDDSRRSREFNAYIYIRQSFWTYGPGGIEGPRDRLTAFPRDGIDFPTHFP